MVRVGLVGEDPNDTSAIRNLLENRYKNRVHFLPLAKGITGHQLDNAKIKRSLPIEIQTQKCELVIFIRDLDGFKSNYDKVGVKIQWFKDLNNTVNERGILLLNIWELEALIFGDIETFNKIYNIKHKFKGDPMLVKDPKGKLKGLTYNSQKQYKESHCPGLFKELNIDQIENRCSFFKDFLLEFDDKLNQEN